ncbi:hypothetical protein BKA62DRAFT_837857 [Auriculariales sp. MPI-PUGE-AT-0066]|nr:hypothetical protein BKA62DRAFT_837857 [Auriculariales sp. MPI-PUGE-AT-0066]
MSHPELVFGAEAVDDPEERFLRVLSYYLAGWHTNLAASRNCAPPTRPAHLQFVALTSISRRYNPVLGEFFPLQYDYTNGTKGYYNIAEQVSHHPPISAYFYISPANKILIMGDLRNPSETAIRFANAQHVCAWDFVGRMVLEPADQCTARNDKLGITCDMDFKTKGYFSGTYNVVQCKVKRGSTSIGDISGKWSDSLSFLAAAAPKSVAPESEQEPNESRRLWSGLTWAIGEKNIEMATESKTAVEESQREVRRIRDESAQKHVTRFFELQDGCGCPSCGPATSRAILIPACLEGGKALIHCGVGVSRSTPSMSVDPA